jgi:hypothetical protein
MTYNSRPPDFRDFLKTRVWPIRFSVNNRYTSKTSTADFGVLSDANPKGNIVSFEVNESTSANKLPVSGDESDLIEREKPKKALHEVDTLLGVGAPSSGKQRPKQGTANTLGSDARPDLFSQTGWR